MELKDIKKCNTCGILISIESFASRELKENENLYTDDVRKKYQDIKGILLYKPMSRNKHLYCPVCKALNYDVVDDDY